MGEKLSRDFLSLFLEKNSDGTSNLRLKGNELWQRIKKRINPKDILKIVEFIEIHPEIIYVKLCYNNLCDQGMETLCKYLFVLPNNIQYLNLMNCNITAKGLVHLLDKKLILKTLRLNGNKLGYEAYRTISFILDQCETLIHLDIGDTRQSYQGIEAILSKSHNLNILDISRTVPLHNYYLYDPTKLADYVSVFLETNNKLVELHIQKNGFDGHDVELLLIGLKMNKTLKMLDLGYNNIGNYGMELLAHWLQTRPNLLGLNVAGNKIGDIGAKALSMGMPLSKLRLLNISHNEIEDEGMLYLLETLKKPYMLRIFYIWCNKFGHNVNRVIKRMLYSTVLEQEMIDVKIYCVDDVYYAAYYPSDYYKHRYYEVMDHGCAVELKIIKHKVSMPDELDVEEEKRRNLVDFKFYRQCTHI